MDRYERLLGDLLSQAGVRLDGDAPWDIRVHDRRFCRRVLATGSLGLGDSYMDGWWDCDSLPSLMQRLLTADLRGKHKAVRWNPRLWLDRLQLLPDLLYLIPDVREVLTKVGLVAPHEQHYNVGNLLYERMLDENMVYTSGYFRRGAGDLATAQRDKLELTCEKLRLEPGMRVLDIGCGWGSFARYAAQTHGVTVFGITISPEQLELGRWRCAGLPVELHLMDYHDAPGGFDRVVSLGMFEHVGVNNYRDYFEIAARCLGDDGIFVLETIGRNTPVRRADAWFMKHIWTAPTSMIPSASQMARASEGLFVMEDWHNFGDCYGRTLQAWATACRAMKDWMIEHHGLRFYRMWMYYLEASEGSFRARTFQNWQVVYSRRGIPGGVKAPR